MVKSNSSLFITLKGLIRLKIEVTTKLEQLIRCSMLKIKL